MKWTYLTLVTFLVNCCSSKEIKIITEIIYQIDTIYIEVNQPMDIFPWELGCADTANTQYAMNQCAAKCFQVADSLTDQIYQLIRMDLIDQNTNRDRMENRFEQMERLDQLQANFTAIKTGSG